MTPERVLVLAPLGRDAAVLCGLLANHGLTAEPCRDAADLVARLREGAGAVLLTDEALTDTGELASALADQPPWSDLPVLLLSGGEGSPALPNLTVLPRPAGATAVLTAARAALRARRRQYEVQDLRDRLRAAREELEARVAEQTAELVAANEARVELLRRLAAAQEEERLRLSRELHDGVGQTLSGHILALSSHESKLPDGSPERESARRLRSSADEVAKEMHDVAVRLRPTALTDVGLAGALRNYVESWSGRTGIAADFHVGFAGRFPAESETALYRVVQEALNNALKHAKATRVSVLLERRGESVAAIVEDNGLGFDVEAGTEDARRRGRIGLIGMAERLAAVGGELEVESSPGGGTTVYARVPLTGGGTKG